MTASLSLPGPRGHWLMGNLPEFRRDMLVFFTRCARDYGDAVLFRLGPKRIVLLSHPSLVEEVLVTGNRHFAKHYILRLLVPLLGSGLLTSEGDFWLRQRRLMQPAFLRDRVASYGPVVIDYANRVLAEWRGGETRDVHAEMMRLTLGIAARTLLDVDAMDRAGSVARAFEQILADFSYRFESAYPLPLWLPTPGNRKVKQALAQLDAVIHGIIKERRAGDAGRGDLLSILLRARDAEDGRGMTDQQLRDEVMSLFLASHETTANALAWTWYLLATHPEAEAQLLSELGAALGGRAPTAADLPRLGCAEHIILEAMRLYPPVYAFGREALRDCTVGMHQLPAGTTVLMSQWVLHRDPRFFEAPDEFRPQRWANGLAQRLPRCAYIPFSAGPRVCIGNTFALMEATLILATLAPAFRFAVVPGHVVKPWPSVTLRPADGIKVVLHRR
ncbi:MAG TPA: cytochrome P450 [Gemmataceae bacterium]|jgi:cytochrome P450